MGKEEYHVMEETRRKVRNDGTLEGQKENEEEEEVRRRKKRR